MDIELCRWLAKQWKVSVRNLTPQYLIDFIKAQNYSVVGVDYSGAHYELHKDIYMFESFYVCKSDDVERVNGVVHRIRPRKAYQRSRNLPKILLTACIFLTLHGTNTDSGCAAKNN